MTNINDEYIWCCITGDEQHRIAVFGTTNDFRHYFSTKQFSVVDGEKIARAEFKDGFYHLCIKQKDNLALLRGEPTIDQLSDHNFFVANTIRCEQVSIFFTINFLEMRPTTTVEEAIMEYMKTFADFFKRS